MTSTLSEAVSLPVETVEDNQDYNRGSLDGYALPRNDESVSVEALSNYANREGLISEGIGTILAKDAACDYWWPIRYRRGHDALGFLRAWLYQANGPGGKFCWHISLVEVPRGRPITITSWGTIGTLDEIKEAISRKVA
jgi:hypothetical protein